MCKKMSQTKESRKVIKKNGITNRELYIMYIEKTKPSVSL